MKYNDYEDGQVDKIPYDKEPIYRQSNYKKSKVSSAKIVPNKVLTFIVCLLIVFNLVLAGLVVSVLNRDSGGTNYTSVNITNNSASNVSAVANKAKLSVVCVHSGYPSTGEDSSYQGFFNMRTKGAGVIFEDDKENGSAYIVTCYHVIKGNTSSVYILLYDSFVPIKASMVYYSQIYDIAVLRVTNSNEYKTSSATPAEIADSSILVEGDMAVAIGNPLSSGISVTEGTVSKTTDLVRVEQITQRVIRTSAAINSGNSGGGLFDENGKLIGIVSAKATDNPTTNSYVDNVAYAIPSNVAISLAYNIIRNTRPMKAVLGISMVVGTTNVSFNLVDGKYIAVQEVLVGNVEAGSAADEAGFEVYDQIVGFRYGDTVVNMLNIYSFEDHVFNLSVGDAVTFTVIRNGLQREITVTIDEMVSADLENWYDN